MSACILEMRDLHKEFEDPGGARRVVLRGASLAVEAGRRVAVIGPSGSGKSTLLHLAAGIEVPSAGSVRVDGRDLAALSEGERARFRRETVGLVFQFFHLLPHLSVLDNVLLPAMIAGAPYRDARERGLVLLERVGLESRAGSRAQKLSGGEQQRVALCRALLRRPRILLADEPTGNLDEENGRRVMDLLFQLSSEEGSTLLFVTHSRDLADRADEVRRLGDGVLHPA